MFLYCKIVYILYSLYTAGFQIICCHLKAKNNLHIQFLLYCVNKGLESRVLTWKN